MLRLYIKIQDWAERNHCPLFFEKLMAAALQISGRHSALNTLFKVSFWPAAAQPLAS
jgi:hypothetical protein